MRDNGEIRNEWVVYFTDLSPMHITGGEATYHIQRVINERKTATRVVHRVIAWDGKWTNGTRIGDILSTVDVSNAFRNLDSVRRMCGLCGFIAGHSNSCKNSPRYCTACEIVH